MARSSTPLASMSSLKIIFGSFIVFVMVAYCTNEMKSKYAGSVRTPSATARGHARSAYLEVQSTPTPVLWTPVNSHSGGLQSSARSASLQAGHHSRFRVVITHVALPAAPPGTTPIHPGQG